VKSFLPILLCAPLVLYGLGRPGLTDPDEGRNAEVAREMIISGDFVTPTINGARYLDKPPAFFWSVAASLRLFGVDEWSARLPSAFSAVAGVALTAWFARRHLGARAAGISGAVLALCPLYIVFGRMVIFDMMLTLFMSACVMAAYEAMEGEGPASSAAGLVAFAAAGLGTITKGPVALVLPLLIAAAWALLRRRPALLLRLHPARGLAVYAAIVLPWLAVAAWRNPGYLRYALLGETLERIATDRFETARPFYFYLKIVLPGFFPWIFYLAGAPVSPKSPDESGGGGARLARRFAWTWLLVAGLFFSLVSSKRPAYVLPLAVPIAILTGDLFARADLAAGSIAAATGCLLLAATLTLLGHGGPGQGLPGAASLPEMSGVNMTAAGLAVAGALIFAARRSRSLGPALGAAILPLAVTAPLALTIATHVGAARSARAMSRFLAERLRPGDAVICFEEYHPGLNFYLRMPIDFVGPTGRTFTSNYIKMHLDQYAGDPSFRKISPEAMRERLGRPGSRAFLIAPPRSYEDARALAGMPLARIYEDPVGGVLVPSGATAPPGAEPAPRTGS